MERHHKPQSYYADFTSVVLGGQMKTSYYDENELKRLGLNSYGENVLISRLCSIYGAEHVSLGSNVRIDDFSVITSGPQKTVIGDYFHLGPSASIVGDNVSIGNFVGISAKVSIFAASDDFSGNSLAICIGVPENLRGLHRGQVEIGNHIIIGANSVVLPDVVISDVVSIGANSLVNKSCAPFGIYAGTPAKRIKEKSKKCLDLELLFKGLRVEA